MLKKILSIVFAALLIFSISAAPSLAAPYVEGGIKIGYGISTIDAMDFDTEDFSELGTDAQWNVRTDMADVGGPQTEVGASGYTGNIGYTAAGEWVQYTINVEAAGSYNFKAYLASGTSPAGTVGVSYDGNLIGQAESVNLGDPEPWQNYDWYNVGDVEMTAGTHVIKVDFVDGAVNFAALEVTALFEEPTVAPADEVPEAQDDDAAANEDEADTTAAANDNASDSGSEDGGNMVLWIAVAAGAVLVIIIIAVLVTKKKK